MNRHYLSMTALLVAGHAFPQGNTSDCAGAIQLCGGTYTETAAPPGTGAIYEFVGDCNVDGEISSLWYTFTVQSPGDLGFILDPAANDDYDWALFDITQGGCAGIGSGTSPVVSCNSFGSFFGGEPTGISSANGGTGDSNGPGDINGPPFNADLPATTGETYALVVMNWSNSPDGYSIDFSPSTATIFDADPPQIEEAVADCANLELHVQFSEGVVTASVEAADFSLLPPSGPAIPFAAVVPDAPSSPVQAGYTLQLPAALTAPGTYELIVTSASGGLEDACGNMLVDTVFNVTIAAPLQYAVTLTDACNGVNGAIHVEQVTGGTAPLSVVLDGQPIVVGAATGVDVGTYTLTISDANGCSIGQELTIQDRVLAPNELALPNVVSPNGDGKNDVWRPFIVSDPGNDITTQFDQYDLTILDRWGRILHTSTEGGQRFWNPRDAVDGTYYYTIAYRLECGIVLDERHNGTIMVLR